MKKLIYLITFLILTSCVSQSDYDKLKNENEQLVQKIQELESQLSSVQFEYEQLREEKKQVELAKNNKPFITEKRALELVKDYYSFYNRDMKYKNVRIRRVSDNAFKISFEECAKNIIEILGEDNTEWRATVRTLTVNSDGTYKF